ncbi:MAG: VCBS repeat-containing protein [Pseudomonadota bacterium]
MLPALVLVASGAGAQAEITRADYSAPTPRYAHGVLGDAIEYGSLVLQLGTTTRVFVLPDDRVFEDIAPRLVDVDGDGDKEVIVVESQNQTGAQLAIYDETGKIAATPHIGTRNRWLAPIGAADLDGDGFVEIAYIDRPHLAKTLRLWRFQDGALTQVAQLAGLTNHRIGEDFISGGLRTCGDVPELIVATANWQRMQAVRFDGTRLTAEDIGPFTGQAGFRRALSCS